MTFPHMLAQKRASEKHGDQRYGDPKTGPPYIAHLIDVVNILGEYGFVSELYQCAGMLHDTVEDTDYTLEELEVEFGPGVARLVDAVTNEPGKNRREKAANTLPKTAACVEAIPLKLADRISNVESCWKTQDGRLFMYQREYKAFRKALRRADAPIPVRKMWDRLDKLLGWWDPSKR